MNSINQNHPFQTAFAKTRISKELQQEFLNFLRDFPEYDSQAIYLLNTKKESVEKIVYDLFDIPIKEQPGWTKAKDQQRKQALVNFHQSSPHQHTPDNVMPRLLFKEWKQEHGFDSPALEIGDIHIFINFTKHITADLQVKYCWDFFRSRHGKRGWGNKKRIRSIVKSLLDNNSNPGWIVRSFLEENYFLTNINGDPRPINEIPNPLVLDDYDTHAFLYLILGHPYFFYGDTKEAVVNTFTKGELLLCRYEIENNFFINGFLKYESPLNNSPLVSGYDLLESGAVLPGKPAAVMLGNKYSSLKSSAVPIRMLQNSLYGVLVPKVEWDEFYSMWGKHYPDYKILDYRKDSDNTPKLTHINARHLKDWRQWLSAPESELYQLFDSQVKPIIRLHPKSFSYQSNKISFKLENFNEKSLQNLGKLPGHLKLFEMIQLGLKHRTFNNDPTTFTFERHEASQFLRLLEDYKLAFNDQGEPLFADDKLDYHLTVKKHPTIPNQYFLQGGITTKGKNGESEEINIEKTRAIGLVPSYLLYKNKLFRINEMLSARLVNDSLIGITIEENEISNFYAITLPFLNQREINLRDPQGLLRLSALYNYNIKGHMTIWEVGGMLMSHLKCSMDTDIGSYHYPLGNTSEEFTQKLDNRRYKMLRDKAQENLLFQRIYSHGWVDEGDGEYSMNEKNAIKFVLNILPTYQKDDDMISYYDHKKLKRWKVKKVVPTLSTTIATNIDWFDVNIKIEYEDKEIDIEKIIEIWQSGTQALALDEGNGIGLIDREWLDKNAPALNRLIASNKRLLASNSDLADSDELNNHLKVEHFQIGLLNEIADISKSSKMDDHWKDLIYQLHNFTHTEQKKIPLAVKANLRDYQKIGVNWLFLLKKLGFCGILSDDMGLGKTLQTLAFLTLEREDTNKMPPALVVAPTSVVLNWENEIKNFTPHLRYCVMQGPKRKKLMSQIPSKDIIIISYNILQRDVELLKKYTFSTIVLDEAQMIKNVHSKNAQTVSELKSNYRISLTGTPIENSVMELWSQFNFLMPGLMGTQKEFYRKYAKLANRMSTQRNLDVLRRQTKPFILRRMKQTVAPELPPKTEQVLLCEMNAAQKRLYQSILSIIKRDLSSKIKNPRASKNRIAIFDGMLKLRQICCDPRLSSLAPDNPPESAKMQLFLNTLTEIVEEGHRILVFSQFVKMLKLMHQPLKERGIAFLQLDGRVNNRQQMINRFQDSDDFPVFLISLKAGGTGINLTGADYVIHYDPWWNPAVEAQATDRAYRIGQKNRVHVYKLITSGSIEEKIQKLQARKKSLSSRVIRSSEDLANLFNAEDLSEIFEL